MGKAVGGVVALIVIAVAGLMIWLAAAPPELLRVADGYSAKIVCSNVFIAGRDAAEVLSVDVQAPGNPVLKLVQVSVDKAAQTVTARMLGLFAPSVAVYRPGLGCASVPDGNVEAAKAVQLAAAPVIAPPPDAEWPLGNKVSATSPELAAILADPVMSGPGMRAVVVVKDGRIIGETYGEGFTADTPLLGWSMTKTVNAALIGMAIRDGTLTDNDRELFPAWAGDARKDIGLRDLLAMSSGLSFNEDYGDVTDVTRMLYLEPDMAGFAAGKKPVAKPGEDFNYSSGTGVLLSRLWMDRVGADALEFPQARLFGPLGMTSAVFEADERGTFVGSSYLYATARDWARFGLFLLDNGVWQGTPLLKPGFTGNMQTSNGLRGAYSQAQTWMDGPLGSYGFEIGLPPGTFWLEGHDGQSIAVMPMAHMVVVRLGLTPSGQHYGPEAMIKAILTATGG